jgi:hypothetical protein
MFDQTFEAKIVSVTPKCIFDKDDTPRRITEVVLSADFVDGIALPVKVKLQRTQQVIPGAE